MKMFLAFCLWIACGVITAVVARNKGRNPVGWFITGMVIAPFGFYLALVMPKNEAALVQRAVAAGEVKQCRHCLEYVRTAATKCSHCGSDVPEAAPFGAFRRVAR